MHDVKVAASQEQAAAAGGADEPSKVIRDLAAVKESIVAETGLDVGGHMKRLWGACCSCKAAGYSASKFDDLLWPSDECSGLPSPIDVPTREELAARSSAKAVLGGIRRFASLVWPVGGEHGEWMQGWQVGGSGGGPTDGLRDAVAAEAKAVQSLSGSRRRRAEYADFEVLQAEMLSGSLPASGWGEGLWCFNPHCDSLSGPGELQLRTFACAGGCGTRYCSARCQEAAWRLGHKLSCKKIREKERKKEREKT